MLSQDGSGTCYVQGAGLDILHMASLLMPIIILLCGYLSPHFANKKKSEDMMGAGPNM